MPNSSPRKTARRNVLERNVAEVIHHVLDCDNDQEVANAVNAKHRTKVTHQGVTAFRRRHAGELQKARGQAVEAVQAAWIESKANRVNGLDGLRQRVEAYIEERGLMERTVTTTDKAEIVRERFAREVSAELRAIYRAAAEELAQITRAPEATVNLNVGVGVQLVWNDGTPA